MTNRHWRALAVNALVCLVAGLFPWKAGADDWTYMDDRSTPQKLIESYYYAISNGYYVQAFSYFKKEAAPKDFDAWRKGFGDTKSVSVTFGKTAPDAGAGQIRWALPVVVSAQQNDGSTKLFTGCFEIHMTNLGMQTDPPYQPMGIASASLKETTGSAGNTKPGPC